MKEHQSGFALITAIFLLVVIAALGTFAVTISTAQQQTSVMDVQGSRAYQAAKAGIEWGIYQITKAGVTTCTGFPQPPALSGFIVTIDCISTGSYTDGSSINVYQLTSTATTAETVGSVGYFERQITVSIYKDSNQPIYFREVY